MKNINTVSDEVSEFTINVAPEVLSDLSQRLKNTRWSHQMEGTQCDAGTDLDYQRSFRPSSPSCCLRGAALTARKTGCVSMTNTRTDAVQDLAAGNALRIPDHHNKTK